MVAGGLAPGGFSRLFADVLGGDAYEPIEPLWPLVGTEAELGVAHCASLWLNGFLPIFAVTLHAAVLASEIYLIEHRFRHWRTELTPGRSLGVIPEGLPDDWMLLLE